MRDGGEGCEARGRQGGWEVQPPSLSRALECARHGGAGAVRLAWRHGGSGSCPNPSPLLCSAYCGSLWLAAVCVMCKVAGIVGDDEVLQKYSAIRQKGAEAFERLLWNGAYGQTAWAPAGPTRGAALTHPQPGVRAPAPGHWLSASGSERLPPVGRRAV